MTHLRRFLAFFCALTALILISGEQAVAQPQRQKSLTVKGFFNVRDTMVYTYDRARFSTAPADTVCDLFEHYEFLITVKEKSDRGYRLHLIPMGSQRDGKVKNKQGPETRMIAFQYLYGMHIEVTLDNYGGRPSISNWQQVKERLMKNSSNIINKLSQLRPDLVEEKTKTASKGCSTSRYTPKMEWKHSSRD